MAHAVSIAGAWAAGASSAPVTPLTLLGATLVAWWRSDLGITLNGSKVSAWADQSGNGFTATQVTAANQLTYSATGGPNARPALVGSNAAATFMSASIGSLPKPCWVWIVIQFTSTTAGNSFAFDGGSINTLAFMRNGATTVQSFSGTTFVSWTSASPTVFQAYGVAFGAGGSIASNGLVKASGNPGTTTSTGFTIGGAGNTAGNADCLIEEIVIASTPPAANALSAYSQSLYGFG